jgi:hypothetical protein
MVAELRTQHQKKVAQLQAMLEKQKFVHAEVVCLRAHAHACPGRDT